MNFICTVDFCKGMMCCTLRIRDGLLVPDEPNPRKYDMVLGFGLIINSGLGLSPLHGPE